MSAIVVDVGTRLVRREGIDIHLSPKAFDLLAILVRNRPNAVAHEELHAVRFEIVDTDRPTRTATLSS